MAEPAKPVDADMSKAAAMAVVDPVKKGPKKRTSIYSQSLLSREVVIPFRNVGKELRVTLERMLRAQYEGKCGPEGFIRPGSVRILTYPHAKFRRASSFCIA